MSSSEFFNKRCGHPTRIPLSFLYLESITRHLADNKNCTLGEAINSCSVACFSLELTESEQESVAARLEEFRVQSQELADKEGESDEVVTYGAAMVRWINGLDAVSICHLLSGFDPELSEKLYCDTDYRLVSSMAKVFTDHTWQGVNSHMEACLYGFGGKLSDDRSQTSPSGESGDVKVFDLTKNKAAGLAALKSLGF